MNHRYESLCKQAEKRRFAFLQDDLQHYTREITEEMSNAEPNIRKIVRSVAAVYEVLDVLTFKLAGERAVQHYRKVLERYSLNQ